jgi:hypothetical protein
LRKAILTTILSAVCAGVAFSPPAKAADVGNLEVGAAKVDITPTTKQLPGLIMVLDKRFTGIHDPIYARALVMGSGNSIAAIVSLDLAEIGDTVALRERIQTELGIPVAHIIISATNDHNAPRSGPIIPGTSAAQGRPYSTPEYIQGVDDAIVDALRKAKAAMQPARVGIGAGHMDLNAQRYGFTSSEAGFHTVDENGLSDRTIWVIKLESLSGEPIAILMNYAMHPIMGGSSSLLSGDISGATSRFVEEQFNDKYHDNKTIALWTTGTGGDQSPKLNNWHEQMQNQAAGEALGYRLMEAEGVVIGSEVIEVATRINDMTAAARIRADESAFNCAVPPKQSRPQAGGPALTVSEPPGGMPPAFGNVPNPIKERIPDPTEKTVQLNLILINQIAITSVNAEVFSKLYLHLRKASPLTDTIMDTVANGRMGYLAADEDYATTYGSGGGVDVVAGCAESGVVNGLVGMIRKALLR